MNFVILSSPHPYKTAGIVSKDLYSYLSVYKANRVLLIVKRWGIFSNKEIKSLESFIEYLFSVVKRKFLNTIKRTGILKIIYSKHDLKYHIQDFNQTKSYYSTNRFLRKMVFKPDIIIILFMQKFLSFKNLYELNKRTGAKVLLFPMDMSPFTGICHYSWDCSNYVKHCGNCPALFSNKFEDQSYLNFKFKLEYAKKSDIELIAANSQISEQIKLSKIFEGKKVIENIYLVPDKHIFRSIPKDLARKALNIPLDKKVLFFGSNSLLQKRKGMLILTEALKILGRESDQNRGLNNGILLLIAGQNNEQIESHISMEIIKIGFIKDFSFLSNVYNAADFFISPSIEESGPTMVLQSMQCNTPVISFNIGYAKDLIIDKWNGFKSIKKDSDSLAISIFEALSLSSELYEKMKVNLSNSMKDITMENILQRLNSQLID